MVHKRIEASGIVPKALSIDQQLSQTFANASEEWKFDVISTPHSDLEQTYVPAVVHRYRNSLSAQIWTSVRNGHLIIHSIVTKTLWHLSLATPEASTDEMIEQMRISSKVMQTMKVDILASAPQQLGIAPFASRHNSFAGDTLSGNDAGRSQDVISGLSPPMLTQTDGLLVFQSNRLPVLRTSRGYNFVWSLMLVAKLVPSDETLRARLCRYMRLGGRSLGMQQAFTLAELLERPDYKL